VKRTLTALIAIVLFAIVSLTTAGTAAAGGKGCPPKQINTIIGSPGHDVLVGTACADVIYGLAGPDTIVGKAGEDRLRGGRGRDHIGAVDGYADIVAGGRGFDVCRGDQLDIFRRCEVVQRFFVTPAH
jgi:Ca2+-binding RTX toxin-like protein